MQACEMCGKEVPLVSAIVEGTRLKVCKNCAKMGKIVEAPTMTAQRKEYLKQEKEETIEILVKDYGHKIREAREKSGLTQEEFAKKLNEKASILQKIEAETFKPTIEKAKRFQKILGIKLVEEDVDSTPEMTKTKGAGLTIGDILKVK